MGSLTRHWAWKGLAVLFAGSAFIAVGVAAYLGHVQASATALIQSARAIRTTADAEREIAAWKKRSGNEFWVESRAGSETTYEAQIVSGLARLGFVELTEVTVDVTMHHGNLRLITVTEWMASFPVVSARIREWFDLPEPYEGIQRLGGLPSRLPVTRTVQPSEAVVVFPSSLREDQRTKAFAFNTKCLVQPSLCKTAENILPGVRQLESSVGPD